jgi:hypothetical protein
LKLEVTHSVGLAEKVSVGLGARSSVLASTTLSIVSKVRLARDVTGNWDDPRKGEVGTQAIEA